MEDQPNPPALPNEIERTAISLLRAAQESIAQIGTKALTLFQRAETDDTPDTDFPAGVSESPNILAIETDQAVHLDQPETAFSRIRDAAVELRARARTHKRHLLGVAAAASAAFAAPFVLPEVFKKPPAASAAEVNQETGGYPWATVSPDEYDSYGLPARECYSYAVWRAAQNGTSPERAIGVVSEEAALDQYEVVDKIPAVGAVFASPGHVMYVEEINIGGDPDRIRVSDYNGKGGPYSYAVQILSVSSLIDHGSFVHLELPPVANGAFAGASPDKGKKNTIGSRGILESSTYIVSPNGQFNLLLDYQGNVGMYDKEEGFSKLWQSNTAGSNADGLNIELSARKGRNNRLVLWRYESEDSAAHVTVKSWSIGKANRVVINDDGTISGFKGKKELWKAHSLPAAPRAAKAAARRQARIVAARKARKSQAHANKAARQRRK